MTIKIYLYLFVLCIFHIQTEQQNINKIQISPIFSLFSSQKKLIAVNRPGIHRILLHGFFLPGSLSLSSMSVLDSVSVPRIHVPLARFHHRLVQRHLAALNHLPNMLFLFDTMCLRCPYLRRIHRFDAASIFGPSSISFSFVLFHVSVNDNSVGSNILDTSLQEFWMEQWVKNSIRFSEGSMQLIPTYWVWWVHFFSRHVPHMQNSLPNCAIDCVPRIVCCHRWTVLCHWPPLCRFASAVLSIGTNKNSNYPHANMPQWVPFTYLVLFVSWQIGNAIFFE